MNIRKRDQWGRFMAEPGFQDFRLHPMPFPTKDWRAYVVGVTDGDTIDLKIDRGVNDTSIWRVRLACRGGGWFDAPESRGAEKGEGVLWQEELALIALEKPVLVHTEKINTAGVPRKTFERYIAWVTLEDYSDLVGVLVNNMWQKHSLKPKIYEPQS